MISSTGNQQIKSIIKLKKQSKERRKQGAYLVEGIRMVREIPKEDLVKVYMTESWVKEVQEMWQEGREYELVTKEVFREMTDTETPQEIMAIVKQKKYERKDILGTNPCIIVLDQLQDPGNLGTIMRTAEGAGVTGIMMSKDTVDVYSPKVVRSTMGSIFRVPWCIEEDLTEGIKWLQRKGVTIYGGHLQGVEFYDGDFKEPCGFMIGNEGNGLRREVSELADKNLRIPMLGRVESLNAATSATVFMYEALRQRRGK